MKHDLRIIGDSAASRKYRVAASSTRYYVGEPLHNTGTYSNGTCSSNYVVVAANDTPVIG